MIEYVARPLLHLILGEATGRRQTTLHLGMIDPARSAPHPLKGRNTGRLGSTGPDADLLLKIARCWRGRELDVWLGILAAFQGQVCRSSLDLLCNLLAMVVRDGLVI